jgi:hypothetical protein
MLLHRFESLRERLLRAGVGPCHVRRYLSELRDHYDDAVRAELANGAHLDAAREAAWARLGTEESLAQSVLERPELRSTAARFPALVFGAGPALVWLGLPMALAGALSLVPEAGRHAAVNAAFIDTYHALCTLYARLMPVLLGAAALEAASGRRLPKRWPLVGAATVDVLAGTLTAYSLPGELGLTSSLLPWLLPFSTVLGPRDPLALGEGLLRAACMLGLSLVVHQLARRFGVYDRSALAKG